MEIKGLEFANVIKLKADVFNCLISLQSEISALNSHITGLIGVRFFNLSYDKIKKYKRTLIMKNKILLMTTFLVVFGTDELLARQYEIPPSHTTSSFVPVISDEAMEACVKLYNEAEWLFKEISNTSVDNYSQNSVNNYNTKVNKHSNMNNRFNSECAGKQSESACKAAKKLNNDSSPCR